MVSYCTAFYQRCCRARARCEGCSCVDVRRRLGVFVGGALLSCTAARVVANTFLEPGSVEADRNTPASHEVERDFAFAGLAI